MLARRQPRAPPLCKEGSHGSPLAFVSYQLLEDPGCVGFASCLLRFRAA